MPGFYPGPPMPRGPQNPQGDAVSPNPQVPGYGAITSQGCLCAVSRPQLPLRYYSSDPARLSLLNEAATSWNEAGKALGVQFIQVLDHPEAGAIGVDWTGRGLPQEAAGLANIAKTPDGLRVAGIGMHPIPGVPDRKLVEVLTHEMGHTLGLDHSECPDDLMFRSTRPDALRPQMLTERDVQMLGWLYAQPNARPILAAR